MRRSDWRFAEGLKLGMVGLHSLGLVGGAVKARLKAKFEWIREGGDRARTG